MATLAAALLDQGTTTRTRAADRRRDRLHRRRARHRRRDATSRFVNIVVMKDSFGLGMDLLADVVRAARRSPQRRSSGSASRRCRRCGSATTIPSTSPTSCSTGSSTGFIPYGLPGQRHAASRCAAITRDDLVAFHQRYFAPNNAHPRDRRRRDRGRGVRRAPNACSATGRGTTCRHRRRRPPPPNRRAAWSSSTSRTRCRPRSASGTSASRASTPTTWRSTWRSRFSAARARNRLHRVLRTERGLTYGASADIEALQAERRHRGRDQHALGGDRRGAAADRRRVLRGCSASAWATRAGGRAGVPDRQLPADDRDARRDRARRC